jgi:LPXTG-motif cell wall-anchored protein
MSVDALRTSENTSPVLGKETKQAMAFGLGGLLLISGGSLKFANRRQKVTGI